MRLWPLVCAHRGRSGIAPENTMAAFEAAVELGADFMELDVRMTADGELVCIHDGTVDRTTDGSGKVSGMTLEQVRALDAGSWKGEQFAGERIPLLREVLERIAPRLMVDIEIKERGIAERVMAIVREADVLRRVTVVSFEPADLRAAMIAEPTLACGLITGGPDGDTEEDIHRLMASALECGANFISCHHAHVTERLVRECHLAGLALMAWTMDEAEDIRRMMDLRVDALVSNYPERVMELLQEREA
ncbi:MAG: glycerophosphodiester phosphodiesterase [Armatimonadota bacterium]